MKSARAAIALAMFGGLPAFAADPGAKAPAVPPPAEFDWTGFYLGAQAGGTFGKQKRLNLITGGISPYKSDGFVGTFHGGYTHQIGRFILGAEGEIGYGNTAGNDGNAGGTLDKTSIRLQGALRARLGYSFGRLMVYTAGGWAFARAEHSNDGGGFGTDVFTKTLNGWTIGGGAEYALTDTLLLRAEYRYSDLGNYSRPAPANFIFPYKVSNRERAVRVGLSYKFGGAGAITRAPATVQASWSGFYAGAQLGYSPGALDSTVFFANANGKFDGFVGGAHAGYNHQINRFVVGAEADVEWNTTGGQINDLNGATHGARLRGHWQTSLRGRAGYACESFLFYGTGGLAVAQLGLGGGPAFGPLQTYTKTLTGYTIGGGLEYAVTRAISARLEYRYTKFNPANADLGPLFPGVTQRNTLSNQAVRAGTSYHF